MTALAAFVTAGHNRAEPGAMARAAAERVAQRHGMTFADLAGRSREAPVVRARHEAMFVLWATGRYSWSGIGRLFGVFYTSAEYGAMRHQERMKAITGRVVREAA